MTISAIQPVQQQTSLRSHVERALSTAIITGELVPGTLLTVPTLAAQFDVSATPVREAMLDLEGRGFVESVKNKGFRVTEVSEDTLRELAEVRQLLEPPAMERLAASFPAERAPEFAALAAQIETAAAAGDLQAYLEADTRFHIGLTRLLGNGLLVETIAELRSRTRLHGLISLVEDQRLEELSAEHSELLGHLQSGDARGAGELMRRHIRHTTGVWAGNPEAETATT
jgi:DNA-binding GntR family transcriptional regulator